MSVVELQELDEVKGLLAKGQQVGVLSYAEITKAMSELDLDESDVEELHGFFERSEIELVEEIDPAIAAALDAGTMYSWSAVCSRSIWRTSNSGRSKSSVESIRCPSPSRARRIRLSLLFSEPG